MQRLQDLLLKPYEYFAAKISTISDPRLPQNSPSHSRNIRHVATNASPATETRRERAQVPLRKRDAPRGHTYAYFPPSDRVATPPRPRTKVPSAVPRKAVFVQVPATGHPQVENNLPRERPAQATSQRPETAAPAERHHPLRRFETRWPHPPDDIPYHDYYCHPQDRSAGPQRVHKERRRARRLQRGHPTIYSQSYIQAKQKRTAEHLLRRNPLVQELLAAGPLDHEDEEMLQQMERLLVDKVVQENVIEAAGHAARAAAHRPERIAKMKEAILAEQRRQEEAMLAEQRREKDALLTGRPLWGEALPSTVRNEMDMVTMHVRRQKLREQGAAACREKEEAARREEEALEKAKRWRRWFSDEVFKRSREKRLKDEEAARRRVAECIVARQTVKEIMTSYEAQWCILKDLDPVGPPSISFVSLPWPVLVPVAAVEDITYERIREFIFHPLRHGFDGKSRRERIKTDVLRWHPDKFNTTVLPSVLNSEKAIAQEVAAAIARLLERLMAEEAS